eukprot:TRINITY_DN94248_c0_g1_i1.p1 TRINITY_DN94248_c0_g1~~TRINITY_DN94248_c0_g1_i1.p1  ORF type:complete len:278 (-),score=47.63 TRINITY_DN94248_c0_g1_i1:111-944(-)
MLPSALLHFSLVELSPIWVSYFSMSSLVVEIVLKFRESRIPISKAYEASGDALAATLLDYSQCLIEGVWADLWRNAGSIVSPQGPCGNLEIPGLRRSDVRIINMVLITSASVSFLGNIVIFLCHGACGMASDWRSGRYLAFTWGLVSTKKYKLLMGLHVTCCVSLLVLAVAEGAWHQSQDAHSHGASIVQGLMGEFVLIALSLFVLLKEDTPPLKYDSPEFLNMTFHRPWWKAYESNNRFTFQGLRKQWFGMHDIEAPTTSFLEEDMCMAGHSSNSD